MYKNWKECKDHQLYKIELDEKVVTARFYKSMTILNGLSGFEARGEKIARVEEVKVIREASKSEL